ncbi:MAG: dihydroorotate dehydrogenase electron transfer subunit [Planctomycetota bacterium]
MTEHSPALVQESASVVRAEVVENRRIAKDTFRLRIHSPQVAETILPGQFIMVRPTGRTDPLLARPYALYAVTGDGGVSASCVDIVYLVLGNGTRTLATLRQGDAVDLWGPMGNTFPVDVPALSNGHLLIVAGGIGQTPFVAVLEELLGQRSFGRSRQVIRPRKLTVTYGVRTAEYLAGVEDFQSTGAIVRIATDDGSAGHRGFVTDLVQEELDSDDPPTILFGCGPEPMLERLAKMAWDRSVPAWVSLETKMACGYGVCFSCVCPVRDDSGWDYRRVCLEGPVFPSSQIAWEAAH